MIICVLSEVCVQPGLSQPEQRMQSPSNTELCQRVHSVCSSSFPDTLDRNCTPERDQHGDSPGESESGNEGVVIINMDTLMHMCVM